MGNVFNIKDGSPYAHPLTLSDETNLDGRARRNANIRELVEYMTDIDRNPENNPLLRPRFQIEHLSMHDLELALPEQFRSHVGEEMMHKTLAVLRLMLKRHIDVPEAIRQAMNMAGRVKSIHNT